MQTESVTVVTANKGVDKMTTEEMRTLGADVGNHILTEDKLIGQTNKLAAILWTCTAEICNRLDFICNRLRHTSSGSD